METKPLMLEISVNDFNLKLKREFNNGFRKGYKQADIEKKRYKERYRLETAIMAAMDECGEINSYETKEIFRIWYEDEDGAIAIDRLINLIIY